MGTITLTKTSECAAGDHWNITVTGDANREIPGLYAPDLLAPITETDEMIFLRVALRLAKIGRTQNQLRTALNNGLTITI